jgi:hypothetical protein
MMTLPNLEDRLDEVRGRRADLESEFRAIAGAALAGDATASARSDELRRAIDEHDRTARLICAALEGEEEAKARVAAAERAVAIAAANARIRELVEERNRLVEAFLHQAQELGSVRQRITAIGDELIAVRQALGIRSTGRWVGSFSLASLSDRLGGMLFAFLPGEVKQHACSRPLAHFDAEKWLREMRASVESFLICEPEDPQNA